MTSLTLTPIDPISPHTTLKSLELALRLKTHLTFRCTTTLKLYRHNDLAPGQRITILHPGTQQRHTFTL